MERRVRLSAILISTLVLLASACVRKVTVAEALPTNAPLSTEHLVNRINSYSDIQTFAAQGSVYVRNYFTGVGNKAEAFPGANSALRLKRPDSIRMQVTAPFISSKVADMVSDGQSFRLAIFYPSDKRRFVYGSNVNELERMSSEDIRGTKDPQLTQAGGLVNMRPQHITDAFLIKPTTGDRLDVFREEVRQEEEDTRPGKKGRRVAKSYYVVYVIEHDAQNHTGLRRKFWFDRTLPDTPLVRQQTFENDNGRLASDVTYMDWFKMSGSNRLWPSHVIIERRNDGYRVELWLEKDSVEINPELPDTTFILENTERLEEVNLDAPRKASVEQAEKPKTPRR